MWVRNQLGYECLHTTLPNIETCTVGRNVKKCSKQVFSRYYLTGMNSAIQDIPEESHILCIGYTIGDMQFTVTGSCYENETVQGAAMREVYEELGVYIDPTYLQLHSHGQLEKKKRVFSTIYLLCVDNCEMKPIQEMPNFQGLKEDKSRKVSIMIYGSRERLRKLMEMAYPMKSDEEITYYGSVPHVDACLLIEIMKNVNLNGFDEDVIVYEKEDIDKEKRKRDSVPRIQIQIKKTKTKKHI